MTPFTLATLRSPQRPQAAIGVDGYYYLFDELQPELHSTVRTLLDDWETSLPMLKDLVDHIVSGQVGTVSCIEQNMVGFETPVMFPDKLMAVGANYSGHLKEMGLDPKKWASMPFFLRPPKTTLVGPGETVQIPKSTKQFDWELELVAIVGKRLRYASKEEAAAAVAGYSIGLDLSCRDLIQVDNDLKVDLVREKTQGLKSALKKTIDIPPLKGIHHVKFAVSNLDHSLLLYEQVFGAKRIAAWDHKHEDGSIYAYILDVPNLGTRLELRLNPEEAEKQKGFDPLTMAVEDCTALEAWGKHLDELHIEHSPILTAIQAWLIVFDDPDGRHLRLYTLTTHRLELSPDELPPEIAGES